MTRAAALLVLLLRWTLAGAPCTRARLSPGGGVRVTVVSSARVCHSVWSREGALLACAWSDDAAAVRKHVLACARESLHRPFDGALIEAVRARGDACVSLRGTRTTEPEVKGHLRVKRGFIVPGTLWCGSGNKAQSYEHLGVFSDTDSCCRQHDQCQHAILSFHSRFGVFNSNIFTMSHCDCDNKFRRCLLEARDSMAAVVGYTFFNVLNMHCFHLSHRLQCAQRNWFGTCKESKMALYAEVHPPTPYQSSDPTATSVPNVSLALMSLTTPPSAWAMPAVSSPESGSSQSEARRDPAVSLSSWMSAGTKSPPRRPDLDSSTPSPRPCTTAAAPAGAVFFSTPLNLPHFDPTAPAADPGAERPAGPGVAIMLPAKGRHTRAKQQQPRVTCGPAGSRTFQAAVQR
ncbi:group 3 secretory phospholipase A2 isoform X8 [Entelurus aequoreus]|uniref:group 3 secretory phospholipase A2 isoform X8 n=1 Tax=Entelurus aequoreus TaxID=161455 RepID=UPI002B1D4377|nr:group 3 secretory phospholipase A2 isoform X8 [Entelurus aequoreus]